MGPSNLTIGPGRPLLTGEVTAFDAVKGVGTVRDDQGRGWFFHCTQITDGSRTVDVGQAVTFVLVPGSGGRYEAAALTPASAVGPVRS